MLTKEDVTRLDKVLRGPMTEAEIELLRDIQGLIEFAIRNGLSFAMVMSILGQDLRGIAQHGMDLDEARSYGFLPKVTGYSKYSAQAVGEPEEDPGG
jgi:hypothetical protein